jgi:hypothetical protein
MSKSSSDCRSVIHRVLVLSPACGLLPDVCYCLVFAVLSCGAPSLTRGRVCHLSVSVCSSRPVISMYMTMWLHFACHYTISLIWDTNGVWFGTHSRILSYKHGTEIKPWECVSQLSCRNIGAPIISAWEWVYATNLSRLQRDTRVSESERETSKRYVGKTHSVLIKAIYCPNVWVVTEAK